jgi:hypothetical protein
MFRLWLIIQELRRFSREASTFLGKSEQLIEQDSARDTYTSDVLRHSYRRILLFAALFPIVFGVIAPIAVPCIVFHTGEYRGEKLAAALVTGILISLGASFFYLFAGVAFGCLLAADEFMDSPVGRQWLKLIGTENRTAARVVCFIAAAAGLVIAIGICFVEVVLLNAPPAQR